MRALLFILTLLLLAGCQTTVTTAFQQPNRAWRLDQPVAGVPNNESPRGWIGTVEFDDQGEMWSHAQLQSVTGKIRSLSRQGPLLLVIFAHGWNNSPQPDPNVGNNYHDFSKVIQALAEGYRLRPVGGYQPQVMGVYLGWRGSAFKKRTLLDFYNRMQAGQRVGGLAATEAVMDCARAAKSNPSSQVVLLGHSFGTIIAENAVNKVLMDRVLETKYAGGGGMVSPFNMVVLVNSAQPSIIPRQFISALKARGVRCAMDGREMPLLLSLTSQTDGATGRAYPFGISVGRWNFLDTSISGLYRKDYSDDALPGAPFTKTQAQSHRLAGAHNDALHSHTMTASSTAVASFPAGLSEAQQVSLLADLLMDNVYAGQRRQGTSFTATGTHRFTVARKPNAWNDTPYWMIHVPREFIHKHGGLWDNPNLAALVATLLSADGSENMHLRFDR